MNTGNELVIKDDAVATANMRRLGACCRKHNKNPTRLADNIGVPIHKLVVYLIFGESTPVWVYNKIALNLNWPEYVSGRRYGALDKPCAKVSENDAADIE